jgi:hypothetical protein
MESITSYAFPATDFENFISAVSSLPSLCIIVVQFSHLCKSLCTTICYTVSTMCRSQWPRGLRRRSAAARLLGLRVRIPPGHGYLSFVSVGMLSGRGVCVGLVTRPQGPYWLWCVWLWSWSLDNEKALVHCRLLRHVKKNSIMWGGSPHTPLYKPTQFS